MGKWAVVLAMLAACGGGDDDPLRPQTHCDSDGACPTGHSCLVDECIADGSLEIGDTCLFEQQCGTGLTCHNFLCKNGCSEVYTLDDCIDETWCKPLADTHPPVGDCSPSECDPETTDFCPDGSACVKFGLGIGGCLPYCEYGFATATYQDTCIDEPTIDNSCQTVGLESVPICLPSGEAGGPTVGEPGCHGVRNPCSSTAICIDVVCRRLCRPGQVQACGPGESCHRLADRPDVFFCLAD